MIATLVLTIGAGAVSSVVALGTCIACATRRSRPSDKDQTDEQAPLLREAPVTQTKDSSQTNTDKNVSSSLEASTPANSEQSEHVIPDSGLCSAEPLSPNNPSRKGSSDSNSQVFSNRISSSSTLVTPEIPYNIKHTQEVSKNKETPLPKEKVKETLSKIKNKDKKNSSRKKNKGKGKENRKRCV